MLDLILSTIIEFAFSAKAGTPEQKLRAQTCFEKWTNLAPQLSQPLNQGNDWSRTSDSHGCLFTSVNRNLFQTPPFKECSWNFPWHQRFCTSSQVFLGHFEAACEWGCLLSSLVISWKICQSCILPEIKPKSGPVTRKPDVSLATMNHFSEPKCNNDWERLLLFPAFLLAE